MEGRHAGNGKDSCSRKDLMLINTRLMKARNLDNSSVTSLKHFFPCEEASGNLTDTQGGVVVQPQPTAAFVFNSSEKSVISNVNGTIAPSELVAGSWASYPSTTTAALFLTAGIIDNTYTAADTIRCAIGDQNLILPSSNGTGWGLSDGIAGQPTLYQHANICTSNCNGSYSSSAGPTASLHDDTFTIRYGLHTAGVSDRQVSKILGSDGSVLIDNVNDMANTGRISPGDFDSAFRLHGYRCMGIALFYFNTIPSDIDDAILWMGQAWENGYRYI